MKRCIKCGSTYLKLQGDMYYCTTCRNSFPAEIIKEHESSVKNRINEGLELNKRILYSRIGPVLTPEEMKEYISSLIVDLKQSSIDDKKEYEELLKKIMEDFINETKDDIKTQLQEAVEDIQDTIIEKLDMLYSKDNPKIKAVADLTTSEILETAKSIEDYSILAFIIRNRVESELLTNKTMSNGFYVSSEEYDALMDNYDVDPSNYNKKYDVYNGGYMLPVILRFRIFGLDKIQSKYAFNYWKKCNLFIHDGTSAKNTREIFQNGIKLDDGINYNIHDFFKKIIEFFRETKLYTRK